MNYEELIKALRSASTVSTAWGKLMLDAAAAIEDLQAEVRFWEAAVKGQEDGIKVLQTEVKRLKECNDELREAQTYIDHYGDKWMTSAKDIPTSAYNHGYMDGKNEAQPHWVSVEEPPKGNGAFAACCVYDEKIYWFKAIYLDGKWLREMDGVELPVNYWMEIPQPPQEVQDGPIITPCRGCSDYDGYGGCKSKGGCARAKKEVQE